MSEEDFYGTLPAWKLRKLQEVKQKMKEYRQKPEVKQKMKEYYQKPRVFQLEKDYQKYKKRLVARTKPSKRKELLENEEALKQNFVQSVDKVINGGTELKLAKKLGIEYKK